MTTIDRPIETNPLIAIGINTYDFNKMLQYIDQIEFNRDFWVVEEKEWIGPEYFVSLLVPMHRAPNVTPKFVILRSHQGAVLPPVRPSIQVEIFDLQ